MSLLSINVRTPLNNLYNCLVEDSIPAANQYSVYEILEPYEEMVILYL